MSSSGSVLVECQVSNDKFSNDDINHPLSCTRIRIRSDEAYDRETNLRLTIGANNIITLNMIENDNITGFKFEDYQTVGYIGGRSPRWQKYKPIFYVFDQSLFRIINSQYTKVGRFEPPQNLLYLMEDVIMTDVPIMSDNFVSNPKIERETNKDPAPTGDLIQVQGDVIVIFRDDMSSDYMISTGERDLNFDIYNAVICININYLPNLVNYRGGFSQDLCEILGYSDFGVKECWKSIFGPDHCLPNYPTAFDTQYINKIKYGRLPGNMSWMDIPDYDPISRETSGLLLHKIEPIIYAPKQFDPFNQLQPTFTPHTKRHIEKREIKNKEK